MIQDGLGSAAIAVPTYCRCIRTLIKISHYIHTKPYFDICINLMKRLQRPDDPTRAPSEYDPTHNNTRH